MKLTRAITILTVVLAFVATALAEDVRAPAYRGDPGSTTTEWDFMTIGDWGLPGEVNYDGPDDGASGISNNPYGTPTAGATGGEGVGFGWQDGLGPGPGGAWVNFGSLGFSVPNDASAPATNWKDLRLQVTFYHPAAPPTTPLVTVTAYPGGTETLLAEEVVTLPDDEGWWVLVQDWRLDPNPDGEGIGIRNPVLDEFPGYAVSEVVIDTICTPEPATMSLLGVGIAALLGRGRKRRRRHLARA